MIIKRVCHFLLDKEPGKTDAKLRYRIKWNGNTVAFNVGFRVDIDKWSKDTQRCKNNTTHNKKKVSASIINKEINRFEEIAERIFNNFEKENTIPDVDQFRYEFNKSLGKTTEKSQGFYDIFNEFTSTMRFQNNWTENTYKKFITLKNHLIAFDENLSFEKLTEDKLNQFIRHLIDSDHRNSTTAKNISLLRWFLRWAYNKEYYKGNIHNTFRPNMKGVDNEVIHLTWNELIKLYNFKFPEEKQYISRVRDVFCFCCFTSLRYSDAQKLKKSDIKNDCIHIVTQKTSDSLKIDLNKYSSAILDKYKDFITDNNSALPVISNQKMNMYLKEMGEICEINEKIRIVYFIGNERKEEVHPKYKLLSSHCGRRTFIVNALYLGIPAEVVMKWTGHKDYQAMKPYIKIVDDLKRSEMDKFNLK